MLYAAAGDREGCRRTGREMVQRWGNTDNPHIGDRVVKACLLLPGVVSAADFARVANLAKRDLRHRGPDWAYRGLVRTMGLVEYRAGRHAEAVKWLDRFAHWADHEDAAVFAIRSMAEHRLGRTAQAQAALAKAKAIVAKLPDPARGRPFNGGWHHVIIAPLLCREAEDDMLTETLKQRIAKLGAEHPDTLHAITDLANRYDRTGRYADAVKLYEKLVALRKAKHGAGHPETLNTMRALATGYDRLGRHADVAKLYEELLARQKAKRGAGHPETLNTMTALAYSYENLGRDADAVKLFEEALKLEKARPAGNDDHLVGTMRGLAALYDKLGRHADALKLYKEVLALQKARLGPHHRNTTWCLRAVAQGLIKLERGAEAVPLIDAFVERLSGKIHWSFIPEMIWLRVRHFEKTRDSAGCRASARMWEEQRQTIARFDLDFLYDAARCRAITAAAILAGDKSDKAGKEATVEADRAITWLKRAVANGYKDAKQLKKDPDLSALRGREDFKKLVAEREYELRITQARAHHERGTVLHRQGKPDEALDSFRKAIVLDPQYSDVVNEAFARRGRLEELRALWEKGLENNPPDHGAWYGYAELCLYLGNEDAYRRNRKALLARFGKTTDLVVAERTGRACLLLPASGDELRQAAALADRAAAAGPTHGLYGHFELAKGLAEYRGDRLKQAIPLLQDSARRCGLRTPGLVLAMAQYRAGRKKAGRQTLAAAIATVAAVDWGEAGAAHVGAWINHVLRREAEALIVTQLSAFLEGKYQPRDNAERLELISACLYRKHHAAAARLYAVALAVDPKLAKDLRAGHRYNAACAAALAGDVSRKTAKHDDEDHARWRKQARDWLRADLAAYGKLRDGGREEDRVWVLQRLQHWLRNGDLTSLRDRAAVVKLPANEQAACRLLWVEVTALYGRLIMPGSPLDDTWFELACLRWLGGDTRGYKELRAQMLKRVGQGKDPQAVYYAACTCLVPPEGSPDPAQAVRWAEQAVRSQPKWAWYLHTQGFAHLRARQWKEAVRRCHESLEAQPDWRGRMLNWLVLAMAHQRLGHREEARQWLARAVQWRETLANPQAIHLTDWLEFQLLFLEAEALVQGATAKK
jgi:tetratricopeptide (TPR) repeat protein